MKSSGERHSFTLPPALLAEVEAEADAEHRPVADIVCELIAEGLSERRWKAHSEQELRLACELGLPDADSQPMSAEHRQSIHEKIAQGMRSVREGRVTDGEAFMAQMNAELTELERQGK